MPNNSAQPGTGQPDTGGPQRERRRRNHERDQGRGKDAAGRMGRSLSLAVILFIAWLLFSGRYQPLLLILGAVSCLVIIGIMLRMEVMDHEAHPIHLTHKAFTYWMWLFKEIWTAAIDVTKIVLSPKLPISPRLVLLPTTQKSELGQVIYANSITLTPGTFAIRIFDDRLLAHALTREGAEALEGGEMDRRVTEVEGLS